MTDQGEPLHRGVQLRRARNLRRISRKKLAEITGVGERTIGRIETGGAGEDAPSIVTLEQELAGELATLEYERIRATDTAASPTGRLDQFSDLDLLSEIARRLSDKARTHDKPDGTPAPTGRREYLTRDAPSAKRGISALNTSPDAALRDT